MELAKRLEDVLTTLYDYEYIDIEKLYNDRSNGEAFKVLSLYGQCEFMTKQEYEVIQDFYEELDSFIKFETNYNSEIGDF